MPRYNHMLRIQLNLSMPQANFIRDALANEPTDSKMARALIQVIDSLINLEKLCAKNNGKAY